MTSRAPLLPYVPFPADPQPLPSRHADDAGGPEVVVRASITGEHKRGLNLTGITQGDDALSIAVSIVAPGIVRVLLEGETPDPQRVTFACDLSEQAVDVSLQKADGRVILASDLVSVQLDLDPFHITFYGLDGAVLLDQNYTDTDVKGRLMTTPFGVSKMNSQRVAFQDAFTAEPDEHFYGFGEKFTDFDKRGQRLEMWNYDAMTVRTEQAYKNVPFFVSTRGYGIFVDSSACIRFDMAATSSASFSIVVPDSALDYYVIVGPELKSIITRYASLVSFPIQPPKWAFGLWVSSGALPDSTEQTLERGRLLRKHNVPSDVLHLDPYWMRFGCWSDMIWDTEAFPDPEAMLRQAKDMGFKVCLWINPYLGMASERFTEAAERGYLLKTSQGEPYVADLWGGYHPPVAIVDFTNPEAVDWFKALIRPMFRIGVDVLKTDFAEGVPADAMAYNGLTGERLHNLYALLYNDAVAEVTAQETGRAGLVWGRSTYAGGQRHAVQWGGDPRCTYQDMAATLRGGLSIGMCGHSFWSHDIGGFKGQPTPEIYVRWAQFGLFSPFSRMHGTSSRLPWDYGEEALRIVRDYVRLRYRLLPYIYTYASIAAETSLPMMRPMVLEFPDDPNTYSLDLQYMFGGDLMVAPIYNSAGRRPVYFPDAHWVDFWTHEVIEGPQTRFIEASLDVLPLYVRANALIPTIEPPDYLTDAPYDLVTVDAYLLDSGRFALRDTDGTTQVSASFEGSCLSLQVGGAKQRLGVRLIPLLGAPPVEEVYGNGARINKTESLAITPDSNPGWTRDQDGIVRILVG
jgi:alpha-D-xyloside xylohydrolase